jgi:hypothetical protein
MSTDDILELYDGLESQLRTVALAVRMLKDIGVNCK